MRPDFSASNPYWQLLRVAGLLPEYEPRLTGRDFLYAATWELNRCDLHGTYCMRTAQQATVRMIFRSTIQEQIKEKMQ